jgi:hypothetical protein
VSGLWTLFWTLGRDVLMCHSDPKKLCEFLLETCRERGVELHSPVRPIGVSNDENGRLSGLKVTNDDDNEDLSMLSLSTRKFSTC